MPLMFMQEDFLVYKYCQNLFCTLCDNVSEKSSLVTLEEDYSILTDYSILIWVYNGG